MRQNDGTPALGDTVMGYDARGNRTYDDNTSTLTNDRRDYYYDARGNVRAVHAQYYRYGYWSYYDVTNAYDARNRRVYKSLYDYESSSIAEWFFYYDALDRLTEVRYTPNTGFPNTYSVFQLFWLGDRLVMYWQTDYPSVTTSKRYVSTDETGRPIKLWNWPTSGDTTNVWAINPSAWGVDKKLVGANVYQPILFAGQYQDTETAAYENDGATVHRPGMVLNGFRTYDPFTGGYLQVDPLVPSTWSSYGYVNSDPIGRSDPSGLMMTVCHRQRSDTISVGGSPETDAGGYDESYLCEDGTGEDAHSNPPGEHGHEENGLTSSPVGPGGSEKCRRENFEWIGDCDNEIIPPHRGGLPEMILPEGAQIRPDEDEYLVCCLIADREQADPEKTGWFAYCDTLAPWGSRGAPTPVPFGQCTWIANQSAQVKKGFCYSWWME